MRNYDATNHKPYPRITRIEIDYLANGSPVVEYVEQMAVVDGENHVQHLSDTPKRHVLDLASITEPVQVVHPATGQAIPGQTVTQQQIMLGLLALIRAAQVANDAQTDAAA